MDYFYSAVHNIVDRLFGAAELRLGEDDQQVVRILRTRKPVAQMVGL